jgi:hypothetical protein
MGAIANNVSNLNITTNRLFSLIGQAAICDSEKDRLPNFKKQLVLSRMKFISRARSAQDSETQRFEVKKKNDINHRF